MRSRNEQRLASAVRANGSYESHEVLKDQDTYDGDESLALVRTTYHGRCPSTGVVPGTYYEVWYEDAGGDWEIYEPDVEMDADLCDYDESYNPTPLELLAESHNNTRE
jgi:hypothetical protein